MLLIQIVYIPPFASLIYHQLDPAATVASRLSFWYTTLITS